MDKCLYITFQPLEEGDGASMKALAQKDAFEHLGFDVNIVYGKKKDGSLDYYAGDELLVSNIRWRHIIFSNKLYNSILDYIKNGRYGILYIRYGINASKPFADFLGRCNDIRCKIFLEIPTYPYDRENKTGFSPSSLKKRIYSQIEKKYRCQLEKSVYRVVTFSADKNIYGIPTIQISNAVSKIPTPYICPPIAEEFNMVTVASIAFWHGIDRLIEGLNKYRDCEIKVHLFVVGGGDDNEIRFLRGLVSKYGLYDFVTFTGPLTGKDLDNVFSKCHVAIGCLGCHRKNIKEVKSLKNVEYAMRGIPFVYSETNYDFDGKSYVYKAPNDDSAINIQNIIDFVKEMKCSPEEIRESVKNFTWEIQLRKIVEECGK